MRKSPETVALIWERDEPGTEVRITYRYCVSSGTLSTPGGPGPFYNLVLGKVHDPWKDPDLVFAW